MRFKLTHILNTDSPHKLPYAVELCSGQLEAYGVQYSIPSANQRNKTSVCELDYTDLPIMWFGDTLKKKNRVCNTHIKDIFYLTDIEKNKEMIPCGNHCIHHLVRNNLITNVDANVLEVIEKLLKQEYVCLVCSKLCASYMGHRSCRTCPVCGKTHNTLNNFMACIFDVKQLHLPSLYQMSGDNMFSVFELEDMRWFMKFHQLVQLKKNKIITDMKKYKKLFPNQLGKLVNIVNDFERIRIIDENVYKGNIGKDEINYLRWGWVFPTR